MPERLNMSDETNADELKSNAKPERNLIGQMAGMSFGAMKTLTKRAGRISFKIGKTIVLTTDQLKNYSPEQRDWMQRAGAAIYDARQVAGLTIDELSEILDLEDKTLLKAVEQGTATLSFDLILRLTSLLARHDPVPFLVNVARGYNPQLWQILEDWGFGQLPTMLERDRQWINIYRSRDETRDLSDKEFAKVMQFTRSAFDMALEFSKRETTDESLDEKSPE